MDKSICRFISVVALGFAASASADDYVEWVGANSGVNWSAGQVQAEGAGFGPENVPPAVARMMACRAAIVDGQRNLLESMEGVRVEGTTIVQNMMIESDTIKSSVEGVLKGARVVDRKPQDDGSCFVTMTAPMGGRFAKDIYAEVFDPSNTDTTSRAPVPGLIDGIVDAALTLIAPLARAETLPDWRDAFDRLSGRISSLEAMLSARPEIVAATDQGPTGLVLDARGSNFIPSMSPRIRKLRAGVIFPNREQQIARRDRGQLVSLFTRDLDTARRHPVVGERPIVMKGLRTFGETRTEIVLGDEASQQLEKLVNDGFLDDAGVIIVL